MLQPRALRRHPLPRRRRGRRYHHHRRDVHRRRRAPPRGRQGAPPPPPPPPPGRGGGGTAAVVGDANVVVRRVEAASADALRDAGDAIKSSLRGRTVILLAAVIDGKPTFLAMATPEGAN